MGLGWTCSQFLPYSNQLHYCVQHLDNIVPPISPENLVEPTVQLILCALDSTQCPIFVLPSNLNLETLVAGDRYLKPFVIPKPEVTVIPRAKDDDCLILASDGLWDVVSNEEACKAARRQIQLWHKNNGVTASLCDEGDESTDPAAQSAADYLMRLALKKGTEDNVTVIVVDLKPRKKLKNNS